MCVCAGPPLVANVDLCTPADRHWKERRVDALFPEASVPQQVSIESQIAHLEAAGLASEAYSILLSDDQQARHILRPLMGGSTILCDGMCLLTSFLGWR